MFDVDEETVEKIQSDEEALLDFGYRWIRFSLFGEKTINIKNEILEQKRRELGLH